MKMQQGTSLKAAGDEKLFSPEQLADYLGIGRTFAYQLLAQKRIPSFDESPWFVGKMAEAVVSFYAALEQHRNAPQHPRVRGAVRRLERLKEMDRIAPRRESASEGAGRTEDLAVSSVPPVASESGVEEPERAESSPDPTLEALRRPESGRSRRRSRSPGPGGVGCSEGRRP